MPEPGVSSVTLAKLRQQKGKPVIDVAWLDGVVTPFRRRRAPVSPAPRIRRAIRLRAVPGALPEARRVEPDAPWTRTAATGAGIRWIAGTSPPWVVDNLGRRHHLRADGDRVPRISRSCLDAWEPEASLAGRWRVICAPNSFWTHWRWRSGNAALAMSSITRIKEANTHHWRSADVAEKRACGRHRPDRRCLRQRACARALPPRWNVSYWSGAPARSSAGGGQMVCFSLIEGWHPGDTEGITRIEFWMFPDLGD